MLYFIVNLQQLSEFCNPPRISNSQIVDIVQEADKIWMYDLKTHDADFIRGHTDFYEDQLNVYAHVWQKLRNNHLDHKEENVTETIKEFAKVVDNIEDRVFSA